MARGFVSGILLGGVFAVGGAGLISVLAPPITAPQVSDAAPTAVSPERIVDAGSGETGSSPDNTIVTNQTAPQTPVPEEDSIAEIGSDAMTTPNQPVVDTTETGLAEPAGGTSDSGLVVAADDPVLPNPQALAPMEPQAADELAVNTEPAQPPAPQLDKEEVALEPDVVVEEVITEETATQPDAVGETAEVAEATTSDPVDEIAETAPEAQSAAELAKSEVAILDPEPQIQPVPAPARVAEAAPEEPDADATPEDAETPIDTDETVSSARPRIGQSVSIIGDRDTGVTIRRPSSASLGQIDDETAETETATQDDTAAADSDPRPIKRFSEGFDDPAGKPLMSIVLIDDGSSPVTGTAGIAALRSFPYPLSFAVSARLSDAEERMTIYRNEGFEVMAMIDLPEGALASDTETAFGAILPQMPEIVGVLEGVQGGLQGSKEVADQVTSILLQTGHGLLTQDKGLNTMPKLARKGGVPADPVFRDFDSKGQSASVIRRFLDQAAFKAGQEGAVVMVGRLRPDTISALLLWGLQDRAGKVALVPISGVLLREE